MQAGGAAKCAVKHVTELTNMTQTQPAGALVLTTTHGSKVKSAVRRCISSDL